MEVRRFWFQIEVQLHSDDDELVRCLQSFVGLQSSIVELWCDNLVLISRGMLHFLTTALILMRTYVSLLFESMVQ